LAAWSRREYNCTEIGGLSVVIHSFLRDDETNNVVGNHCDSPTISGCIGRSPLRTKLTLQDDFRDWSSMAHTPLLSALQRAVDKVAEDEVEARQANPYTKGSYSYWKVGQYTAFAGAERERSGNCHFAGEHTSIDFQGYLNGAVDSGYTAAAEILADLK
jgi:hypothetical protein